MSKQRKGRRSMLLAVTLLMLSVLLGACGVDSPTGGVVQTVPAVVTLGTPTAGTKSCKQCHQDVSAKWEASRHGNVENNPSSTSATCAPCHNKNGDRAALGRNVVGCESCHGPGSMHASAGGAGPIATTAAMATTLVGTSGSLAVSGQFQTCHQCHQLLNPSDPASNVTPSNLTQHNDDLTEVIWDTHYATYMKSFGTASLTGYALNYDSDSVCTDCHAPHGTADINREWAASAHADKYGINNELAGGYNRSAWARLNWSCNGTSTAGSCGTTSFSDRGACQRCHTTEGFRAFANELIAGNADRAKQVMQGDLNFTYNAGAYTPLASVVTYTTAGWKPQMLMCNACHTDNRGTLRNPGAFLANYDYYSVTKNFAGPAVSIYVQGLNEQYPDLNASNICVTCHSGRESGETIKALNSNASQSAFAFNNNRYITPHELTGAGTVFGKTGYEFTGRSYEDNAGYRHKNIGTSAEPGTGSSGPCVGCHMSRPQKNGNHLFLPITRAAIDPNTTFIRKQDAVITGIASEVCFNCHGPNDHLILDMVKEQKKMYAEAIEAVVQVAELSGYFWNEGFYRQRDGSTLRSAAGSAIVTQNTATVVLNTVTNSTFTNWQNADVEPGDQFRIDSDGTWYTILSVDSGTQITLTTPYTGRTRTDGRRYTIKKAETVSVTNASTLVTGVSVSWLRTGVTASTVVDGADHFRADNDGTWYQITGRTANTLTLATPYTGTTTTVASYTIRRLRDNANAINNWLTPADTDVNGNGTGKKNMGSAFNLYIMESDPAGYVHNRYYMKRLMYDTIDWLDDNSLNYSTGETLTDLCTTLPGLAWCAEGAHYILPNGVINGVAAERP